MFINCIAKFFFRFAFILNTVFLVFNTTFVFSNQLNTEEGDMITESIEENNQQSEDARSRERRNRPKFRAGSRRGSTQGSSSVRNTSPSGRSSSPQASGSSARNTSPSGRASSPQASGSSVRNTSPSGRASTSAGNRKRPSPTKPKGSPSKQVKIVQKPIAPPPGGLPVVHAPTAIQSNDRYRLLRGVENDYKTPLTFNNPQETAKSFRQFRLQWRTNGESNAGMEHILKRHTREYHDGSFKKTQSMFPQGTTHVEIKNMIKEVAETPLSRTLPNSQLGVNFLQIEGIAKNNTPLVVGYRKNVGQNKPLDIVQAYPKGAQYEVNVLPAPSRRRRGLLIPSPSDVAVDAIGFRMQQEAQEALFSPAAQQAMQGIVERRNHMNALSLGFSNEENQTQSISITWEPLSKDLIFPGYSMPKVPYSNPCVLYRNKIQLPGEQRNSMTFVDQPEKNSLTEYRIVFKGTHPLIGMYRSAVLTVGAEKITNLKATIVSDHKIRLNWDTLDPKSVTPSYFEDPIEVKWAIFRNAEMIDIPDDANSFEDIEVEPNQVYIYRIMAFIQEEEWEWKQHAICYSKPLIVSTEKIEDFEQDSFVFHTYLLSEQVADLDLNGLNEYPEDYYTSIADRNPSSVIVQNSLIPWEDNTPVEMLNGLIDVEVNGCSLVSPTCFDNVRMLWDYLLVMVEQYLKKNQATIYFPDQPIPISLKKKSQGLVEFQIDDQFVTIDEKKCLTAILKGAEQFFTLLNEVSIDKYSVLLEQIRAMRGQTNPLTQQPAVQSTMQAQAKRISMNRVLLSWIPSDKQVKNYEILLDGKSIITLPAYKTSYTHIFQPKEQMGKSIYKIVSYDRNNTVMENTSMEIEIEEAYLQIQKIVPSVMELSWTFPEQNTTPIGYYLISRNGTYLGVTNETTYRETPLAVGKYTYEIKALDSSMDSLAIEPIVMEKIASNKIALNWQFSEQDIPSIAYYQIYRNGISLGVTNETTYRETPSTVGKYTYKIEALDAVMQTLAIDALVKEIEVVQEDLPLKENLSVVKAISQAQVQRTSAHEVLLSWTPVSAQNIKSYEILINEESLIVLPAETQEYKHNIEQTDQFGKCIYKLIAYDQNDRKFEPYSVEFEITTSYLQVEKITSNAFELSWLFLGQDADSIEFYTVSRNGTCIRQAPKDITTLTDTTLLAPGVYTYTVKPLDDSGSALEIQMAVKEMIIIQEESSLNTDD